MGKFVSLVSLSLFLGMLAPDAKAQPLDGFTILGGTVNENQSAQFPIYFQDVSGTPIDTGDRFIGAIFLHFTTQESLLSEVSFEKAGVLTNASILIEIQEIFEEQNVLKWGILFTAGPNFTLDQTSPGDLIGYLNLTAAEGSGGQNITLTPIENEEEGVFVCEIAGTPCLYLTNGELYGNFEPIQIQGSVGDPPPTINSFTVNPGTIQEGQSATLSWNVLNADSVSIDQGIGIVSSSGSRVVSPDQSTTYELTATNDVGNATRTATLSVNSTPDQIQIQSFTANPSSINAGESSQLSWSVTNANNIQIQQGGSTVISTSLGSGSTVVFPNQTATYTLTASADGLSSKMANITVTVATSSQVVINNFSVDKANINFEETATLSWQVSGANSVNLTETASGVTTNLGPQETIGERVVQPLVNTQYTLTGTGSDGSASETVSVTVAANDALKISPDELVLGPDTNDAEVEVSNVINRPLGWQIQSYPDWMSITPLNGNVTNSVQRIDIEIERSLLIDGLNQGEITFFAGEEMLTLPVTAESDGQQNTVLVYPFLRADGIHNTSFSLINLEDESVKYRLNLFNQDGSQIGSTETGQLDRLETKAWNFSGANNGQGWGRVLIENAADAQLSGVVTIRSIDGLELYSYSPTKLDQGQIFVPHIAKDSAFFTQGSLVNVAGIEDDFQFTNDSEMFPVANMTSNQQSIFDFREDVLGGTVPDNGWGQLMAMGSQTAMSAVEIFGRNNGQSRQTVAVSLDNSTSASLWFPHIAADVGQFWTGLVIINPNSQAVTVDYEVFDSEGEQLQGRPSETYSPGEKRTFLVDSSIQSFGEGATWLRASSPDGDLLGYVLFGSFPSIADRFAGFQSAKVTHTELCFPHIEQTVVPGSYTGLAVVNTGTSNNNLQFRLVDKSGQTKAQEFVLLKPKQKYVNLATNIFSEYLQGASFQKDDKIVALGTTPLAGFEIFGTGTETMGSVLATGFD